MLILGLRSEPAKSAKPVDVPEVTEEEDEEAEDNVFKPSAG